MVEIIAQREKIDLMNLIPSKARNIVEVGCMCGAMARTYRDARFHVIMHHHAADHRSGHMPFCLN